MVYFAAGDLNGAAKSQSQSYHSPQTAPTPLNVKAETPLIKSEAKTWKDMAWEMTGAFAVGTALGGIMSYSGFKTNGYPIYYAFPTLLAYGFGALNSIASLNVATKKFTETLLVFGAAFGGASESMIVGVTAGAIAGVSRLVADGWKKK